MITQLDPPIFLDSPKGSCLAHFLIDYGMESDIYWICFQDETGECWTWNNKDIRIQKNITLGRTLDASHNSISTNTSISSSSLSDVTDRRTVPLYPISTITSSIGSDTPSPKPNS